MKQENQCEQCFYNIYDEVYESTMCQINLDEDEFARLSYNGRYTCPYFRFGDDYSIVKKQI
jgi:hypothetical protein